MTLSYLLKSEFRIETNATTIYNNCQNELITFIFQDLVEIVFCLVFCYLIIKFTIVLENNSLTSMLLTKKRWDRISSKDGFSIKYFVDEANNAH